MPLNKKRNKKPQGTQKPAAGAVGTPESGTGAAFKPGTPTPEGGASAAEPSCAGLVCGRTVCAALPEGRAPALMLRLALPRAGGEGPAAKSIDAFYADFGAALRSFGEKELLPRAASEQALCRDRGLPFRRFVCDVSCALSGRGKFFRAEIRLKVLHRGKIMLRRIFIQNWDVEKGRLVPEKICLKTP